MSQPGFVLDKPELIQHWVVMSRMYQLSIELKTGLKHSRMPTLKAMYLEGLIDKQLPNTRKNKLAVLKAMVDQCKENDPSWTPQPSLQAAYDLES